MRRIRQKLAGRSGASILIALIVFLVAAMVSVVMIDTAVTALKRVHDDEIREQAYLSVGSASKLIASCLQESSCTITQTVEIVTEPR